MYFLIFLQSGTDHSIFEHIEEVYILGFIQILFINFTPTTETSEDI